MTDIPLDPEDIEATRPEDYSVCMWCRGEGQTANWAGSYETCGFCRGLGEWRPL